MKVQMSEGGWSIKPSTRWDLLKLVGGSIVTFAATALVEQVIDKVAKRQEDSDNTELSE